MSIRVNSMKSCSHIRSQHGFTLLEMVLVLFLMGLLASATLFLTDNVQDQAKYDETKHRMQLIRYAIVGDTSRSVNNRPELTGFVADMGRLPACLKELLEAEDCSGTALTTWTMDSDTGVGLGWRGPYLQVVPELDGHLRFRDGYGNSNASDAINSGWTYTVAANDINLVSSGYTTDSADDISASPLIVSADWSVTLPASIEVTFNNQSPSHLPITGAGNLALILRIYLTDLSSAIDANDGTNDYLVLVEDSVIANSAKTETFLLNSTPTIALGTRAYAVVCYDAAKAPANYVIFDGDCSPTNATPSISNIRSFSVVPRQNLHLNLDWNIS
jgi:prepilin-type N-terminal cleavage/methylation domain-containing protein